MPKTSWLTAITSLLVKMERVASLSVRGSACKLNDTTTFRQWQTAVRLKILIKAAVNFGTLNEQL